MNAENDEGSERLIAVRGHRLCVSVRGTGLPVLLINGLGGSLALWNELQHDLTGMQVISFDAPGTGRSSTPTAPYSVAELASVAAALLDELGLDRVDVVGYSFGGVLGQQFTRDYPERVRRLVLVATTPGWGGLAGEVAALLSIVTPARYYSKRAYELTASTLAGGAGEADPIFIERTASARVQDPPSLSGYALQLLAGWSWSSLPWLQELQQATLVVTGTEDRLIPAVNSELITSRLPCARLVSIEDWGHYVILDQRSGAGGAIADFLGAERLEDSEAWRFGRDVDRQAAETAATAHSNLLTRLYWPHAVYRWWHTH